MIAEYSWRYTTLGLLMTTAASFIIIQMVRIQTSPQAEVFRNQGAIYAGSWQTIQPTRGMIYDRWGNLLAGSTTVYEVGVELAYVKNPSTIALALNAVVGSDYSSVFTAASQPASKTSVYAVLANYVTEEQKARLERFAEEMEAAYFGKQGTELPSLAGLRYTPHLQRSYPEKDLASNVLGFVSREGKGYFGVEEKFDDLLRGTARVVWVPSDPSKVEELPEIPIGAGLVLTIDREIQAEVESILDQALVRTGSEAGTIVVMDPKTGEILAMSTTPRLDLNEYWRYADVYPGATPFNRAVSKAYEPGSVFKVMTMAAALDQGAVTPSTTFLDTGSIEIGGIYIRNWNWGAWGSQDMLGCMQHSLNVCLAWVAKELGANSLQVYAGFWFW
ncbi:MAG: peptidoglycan D,D-transpeptidase FtsI family protein [Anaerolineales bacterium]